MDMRGLGVGGKRSFKSTTLIAPTPLPRYALGSVKRFILVVIDIVRKSEFFIHTNKIKVNKIFKTWSIYGTIKHKQNGSNQLVQLSPHAT